MKRLLCTVAAVAGGAAAGWVAVVKIQGDSEVVFDSSSASWAASDARFLHGEITVTNRGKAGCILHKVEGRIVDGSPGRVLVTRRGSRPPERGWWQSNCLVPGESCVAEVDIELDQPSSRPVGIELDAHEIGRRLLVHRTIRLRAEPPEEAAAATARPAGPASAAVHD